MRKTLGSPAYNRTYMPRRNQLATLALVLLGLFAPGLTARSQMQTVGDGGPGPVKAAHLTAELTSLSPAIAPGGAVTTGLVLT